MLPIVAWLSVEDAGQGVIYSLSLPESFQSILRSTVRLGKISVRFFKVSLRAQYNILMYQASVIAETLQKGNESMRLGQ